MRSWPCSALALVASAFWLLTIPSTAEATKKRSAVTVLNQSDWEIHYLYLSPTDENDWGPDQLSSEVIDTNDSFVLTDIPCDTYDVRIVDEDDDECIVRKVKLCGDSERWVITSRDLLACQVD
jgi:hypothetical protein